MIIEELKEVEGWILKRSGAWFEFDSPLCSQRAKGTASASVTGWWFEGRAINRRCH